MTNPPDPSPRASVADASSPDLTAGDWPEDGLEPVTACPSCGADDRRVLHGGLRDRAFRSAPGTWTLWTCTDCGCAYLDPRPTPTTIHLAYRAYFTHSVADHRAPATTPTARLREALMNGYLNSRWGYDAAPASAAGRVVGLIPALGVRTDRWVRHLPAPAPGARLLDVGSGSGAFVAQMSALGWTAEGVEPDPVAVAVARERGLSVTEGTVDDLDGAATAEAFSAATMSHVIEHLRDPPAALTTIRRMLRPGGVLWIATPNLQSLGRRLFGPDWLGLDPPRHLVLFTHDALRRLLEVAGFQDIAVCRASSEATLTFPASADIARGRAAPGQWERPRGLRARATLADLIALRRPGLGEDVVLAARRR